MNLCKNKSQVTLDCRTSRENRAVQRMKPQKPRPLSQQMRHDKELCSNTISDEHRPNICSPSPFTVMFLYKYNIFTINNQQSKCTCNYFLNTCQISKLKLRNNILEYTEIFSSSDTRLLVSFLHQKYPFDFFWNQ